MLLYVHRDQRDREPRTATSTFTQLLRSGALSVADPACTFIIIDTQQAVSAVGLVESNQADDVIRFSANP